MVVPRCVALADLVRGCATISSFCGQSVVVPPYFALMDLVCGCATVCRSYGFSLWPVNKIELVRIGLQCSKISPIPE